MTQQKAAPDCRSRTGATSWHKARAIPRAAASAKEMTMQYLILIYGDERAWADAPQSARDQMHAAHMAYGKEMREKNVMLGGAQLAPTRSATTLRLSGGKPVVTDGPFAETKEQLGGYYLI